MQIWRNSYNEAKSQLMIFPSKSLHSLQYLGNNENFCRVEDYIYHLLNGRQFVKTYRLRGDICCKWFSRKKTKNDILVSKKKSSA